MSRPIVAEQTGLTGRRYWRPAAIGLTFVALSFAGLFVALGYFGAQSPNPDTISAASGSSPDSSATPTAAVIPSPTLDSLATLGATASPIPTEVPSLLPSPTSAPTPLPTFSAVPSPTIHVVERGETLIGIAGQYGVRVKDLAAANGILEYNRIYIGQQLVIP